MASIWVTGSSAGIGRQTAITLVQMGHRVVLHARNEQRAVEAEQAVPGAAAVVIGDLASLAETRALAQAAGEHGPYDVVVHNAGIGGVAKREITADGLDPVFQVNALAPYVLTALMSRPRRLVYLSSGLHYQGSFDPDHLAARAPHRRRDAGLLRLQVVRCAFSLWRGQAMADDVVERRRPRLGKDGDGWSRRARSCLGRS